MAKRPEIAVDQSGIAKPHADAALWGESYPLLMGYMTDATFDDGKARKPGRVMIDAWKGQWRFTLKEPNHAAELCVSVEEPSDGFAALEAMLRTPAPPWTVDSWAAERLPKKKK